MCYKHLPPRLDTKKALDRVGGVCHLSHTKIPQSFSLERQIQFKCDLTEFINLIPDGFQIFIRQAGQKTLTIDDMTQTDYIEELKQKVCEKTGCPTHLFRLTYQGKSLCDDRKTCIITTLRNTQQSKCTFVHLFISQIYYKQLFCKRVKCPSTIKAGDIIVRRQSAKKGPKVEVEYVQTFSAVYCSLGCVP